MLWGGIERTASTNTGSSAYFTATAASTSKPPAHTSFPCGPGILDHSIPPPLPCENRNCKRALVTACRERELGQLPVKCSSVPQGTAARSEPAPQTFPVLLSTRRVHMADVLGEDPQQCCTVQECVQLLAVRQEPGGLCLTLWSIVCVSSRSPTSTACLWLLMYQPWYRSIS